MNEQVGWMYEKQVKSTRDISQSAMISMAWCKTAVSPLWRYCSFALSHRHDISCITKVEHRADVKPTEGNPYIALTGEP